MRRKLHTNQCLYAQMLAHFARGNYRALGLWGLNTLLCMLAYGCASGPTTVNESGRIGSLEGQRKVLEEPLIDDALERALASYQSFLQAIPEEGEVTPEAMRRLADLKLQALDTDLPASNAVLRDVADNQNNVAQLTTAEVQSDIFEVQSANIVADGESETELEKRATAITPAGPLAAPNLVGLENEAVVTNLQSSNTQEAIALYESLLEKYPLYDRNDQVLYQLARAYEDSGQQEKAMTVLNRLVEEYPTSIHFDEAQFRRGEIFFVKANYFDAEKAYDQVVKFGSSSAFYDQSLLKKGWSLFKQSLFEEALDEFITLIKLKTAQGYHLEEGGSKTEYQRVQDTLRVASFSFSYIGDADAIKTYFEQRGNYDFEYLHYNDLAQHFLEKRRYSDAAKSYLTFYELYPFSEQSPVFHEQVIEVYKRGNFPKLVIDSKRDFAGRYRLDSEYWTYHDINQYPDTLAFIKTNLTDLAKHYHALSQQSKKPDIRENAYREAITWYRAYIASFPEDSATPDINFLLAELLFENKAYGEAAQEYETTAYAYPVHSKAAESAYAAVLAYQEYEKTLLGRQQEQIHIEMIRSSLQFAESFPQHPEVPPVLTNAAQKLYALQEFDRAIFAADQLIQQHPGTDANLLTTAWTVRGFASFDSGYFEQAEESYYVVSQRLPTEDPARQDMLEQLAAAIYKQGEQHLALGQTEEAITDYLRIATVAPNTQIRETAEYDAGVALIGIEAWQRASEVLQAFRSSFPDNPLQGDVTQKLAFVYEKDGKLDLAAQEYERVAQNTEDPAIRREALLISADFYQQSDLNFDAIRLYERYTAQFSQPVEEVMEAYNNLAQLYLATEQADKRIATLETLVALDANAGDQRTARTQYLAAYAALGIVDPVIADFEEVKLSDAASIKLKSQKLKAAQDMLYQMVSYGVAEVTAASTYKIANLYYVFSQDFLDAERPSDLNADELEQYEFLLEEQAFEFEEKALDIHYKNIEFMQTGVYNQWVVRSLQTLAELFPVRYAKVELNDKSVQTLF